MADTLPPDLLKRYTNVADARLGAVALFASDEFFAPKERMLQPSEPEWRAGIYDEHGKWMDGWESRRRRDQGHDYCVVKLGAPSTLAALEIDTRHFTGNYPPFASVQASSDNSSAVSFGLGYMVGWSDEIASTPTATKSWNLGLGVLLESNVQRLGDGIHANQPLPDGETQVRYKQSGASSLFILLSRAL